MIMPLIPQHTNWKFLCAVCIGNHDDNVNIDLIIIAIIATYDLRPHNDNYNSNSKKTQKKSLRILGVKIPLV